MLQALVVVDKDKGLLTAVAVGPAQAAVVALGEDGIVGEDGGHRSDELAEVGHEGVNLTQGEVVGIDLTKFTQGCLEVVGLDG